MESTKHSFPSQQHSTLFPFSSSQLQGGYMGQQMGYSYTQQHELFGQYNNLYPSPGFVHTSLFPDKREVILREIEKERIRGGMMVIEIAKMRILEGKIGKEVSRVGASKSLSDIFLKKTVEVWSCTICQDHFISESALNEHLCGKKHKFGEGSFKPQSLGNDVTSDNMLDTTELLENPKPDKYETDQSKRIQSVRKNPDLKKTIYNFWCEMCQVGVSSEIIMTYHEKGKKHRKRLNRRAENGETVIGNQNENMEVRLDFVQHVSEGAKNIIVENVNVCEKGTYNSVNEVEEKMALEVTEQDEINAQRVDIVEPGPDSAFVYLPEDEIIAKGEWRQTGMRPFLPDTFVLGETELLEHSKFDQLKTADISRVSEVKCGTQNEQEEEEIVLTANPDATISGLKLKAVTTPAVDTSKHPFDNILYQNAEVITTSESALNEDSVKLQSPGKNSSIGKNAPDTVLKQTEGLENLKPDNLKNDQETIQRGQLNGDPKKVTYSFWCEMCQVGTLLEIDMNCHEKGKKHLRRLKERAKKGVTGESNHKEEISIPGNSLEHISDNGKSMPSRNTDVVLDESRLELRKPLVASANGFETLPDRKVSEVVPLTENVNEEETIIFVANPDATLSGSKSKAVTPPVTDISKHPEVIAASQSVLSRVSVILQSPGRNSSIGKIADDTVLKKTELLECSKPDNLKMDQGKTNQSDSKKTKYSFWCEMCQVGALSKIVMDGHKKGKKHLRLLEVRVQKPGTGESPVNSVDHVSDISTDIASCPVDGVLDEARLDLRKPVDASDLGHKILPIQIMAADLRVSEAMPVTSNSNEETKIFMANPDATISGSKTNAVTPPVAGISKHSSDKFVYDKTEVIVTSPNGSSLKPQSPGKNSSLEKIAADSVLLEHTDLLENMNSDNFIKDQQKKNQCAQKNGDSKKSTYSFWCELCQVGTVSEIVMNGHEKGKKHLRRLEERAQKGETGECSQKEKIEMPVNSAEHASESGENIHTCNIDVVLDEARLECRKSLNASDILYEKAEVTTVSESVSNGVPLQPQIPGMNCSIGKDTDDTVSQKTDLLECPKPDNLRRDEEKTNPSGQNNGDPKKIKYSYWCEMCQVGGLLEKVKDEHEMSKKHLRRLKLRLQKGGTGEGPVNTVDHVSDSTKGVSCHVDEVLVEARLDLHKPLEALDNGHNILPIQIRDADLRISEAMPVTNNGNEETNIFMANLDATKSGLVLNAVTPPVADNSKHSSDQFLYNKTEATVTSELASNGSSLKPPSPGKSSSLEKIAGHSVLLEQTDLLQNMKSDNFKMDQEKINQSAQKSGNPKKSTYSFWCELCQVGTLSEIVMNGHEKGKKHLRLLAERGQKCETGEGSQKEKIEVPVNSAEHASESGKIIHTCNIDVVLDKASLELRKPLNESDDGFEIRAANCIVSEVTTLTKTGNEEENNMFLDNHDATKFGSKLKAVIHVADICRHPSDILYEKAEVIAVRESVSNGVPSKPQSPEKNSIIGKITDVTLLKKTELLECPKPDNLRRHEEKTNPSRQNNGDPKKTEYSYWCEMCQVGGLSEKVKDDHEKSKKHLRRLEVRRVQKGGIGEGPVNNIDYVSDSRKGIATCHIDEVFNNKTEVIVGSESFSNGSFKPESPGKFSSLEKIAADSVLLEQADLLENIKSDNFKKDQEKTNQIAQKSGDPKKSTYSVLSDATIFGSKLKAVIPPVADSSVCPSGNIFLKKTEEWSCAICQVNFIRESDVNEYLCEKKHRCGEGLLKPQSPGNNVSSDSLLDETELLKSLKPGKYETDQAKRVQNVNEYPNPKKALYNFWCEMCQVGASSEIVMNDHERGKKHLKHLKGRAENGDTVLDNQNEKMEVPLDCVQHVSEGGTNIDVENDNVCVNESYKSASECKMIKDERALEVTEQDVINAQHVDIVEPGFDLTIDTFLPEDDVIANGEWRETEMRFLGDTYLLKETELLECSKSDQLKTIRIVQKNDYPKRTTCQVGTMLVKNINDHAEEVVQNAEMGLYIEKEKIEEPVSCDTSKGGKSKCLKNVDLVSAEARTFLMQIGTTDLRFSEVRPAEKEEIIVVDNTDADSSSPSAIILYKNAEGERGSFATSESSVSQQLCEKKHKFKEAVFEPQSPRKNFNIGKMSRDTLLLKKSEPLVNPKADNIKKNLNVKKKGDSVKREDSFWREKCRQGISSEVVIDEKKGRKDVNLQKEIVRNNETRPCNQKKNIEVSMNYVEHASEKSVSSDSVEVLSSEARLELPKPSDASDNAYETLSIQIEAVDLRVSKDNTDADPSRCPSVVILYKTAEGERSSFATNESSISEQLCEKKQKFEEAAFEPQSPQKNSNIGKMSRGTLLLKKPEPLENPKARNIKKNLNVKKTGDSKKKEASFWREKCRLGISSEVVIDEKEERKDVNLQKEIAQNSETRPCNQKNIGISTNYFEHASENSVNSVNVEVLSSEARLELPKPSDVSDNAHETLSIQREAADLRVSKVSPNAVSGSKWKAVTTPPVLDTSISAVKGMCEKKYKLKVDSLKPASPRKHSVIGKLSCDTLLSNQTEVLVNLKSDNFRKEQTKTIQTSVKKTNDPRKAKEMFWHEKDLTRNSSSKVVNVVDKGKKHHEIGQIEKIVFCEHKEKIDEPGNRVKHVPQGGNIIFSQTLTKQDATATGVDIIRSGDTHPAVSHRDGKINAKSEWNCDLCQVIATNKSSLNEHLRGKKHKLKEASLKAQRPRNNSSVGNVTADTLLENPKSANIKKNSAITVRNVDLKHTTCSYWRQSSQVEPSEKDARSVEKGKKSAQNDEGRPCNQEKMEVHVNRSEHVSDIKKNIISEFFGVALG